MRSSQYNNPVRTVERLCVAAQQNQASDLFLLGNAVPRLRINGSLVDLNEPPLAPGDIEEFWKACGASLETRDYDGSFTSEKGIRFRVNLFRALDGRGAVLRQIKRVIPTLEQLGAPSALLQSWFNQGSGLILVTGPTGMGKSTTVAACLEEINTTQVRHIVTIEDPIEYLFEPKSCLFTQREVGSDTTTFAEGLRRSLRQSPDVIFLGEIRDSISAITALQASETGHLVMATLHSSSVLDVLERLARLFGANERDSVLHVLSQQLVGILCQKLVTDTQGGRALAVEHFENQAVTRKWIAEGKFRDLADFISRGDNPTNATFLHSLAALVRSGRIAEETAMSAAPNPHELQRKLRGIGVSSV